MSAASVQTSPGQNHAVGVGQWTRPGQAFAADQSLGQRQMPPAAYHQFGLAQPKLGGFGQAGDTVLADPDDGQPGSDHAITGGCAF
jgi:hypothetical protein